MSATFELNTGICRGCRADGAEQRVIVGCRASGTDGRPVLIAELCESCKDIAEAMSLAPGALTAPPWELR